jgi:hypothetical protein
MTDACMCYTQQPRKSVFAGIFRAATIAIAAAAFVFGLNFAGAAVASGAQAQSAACQVGESIAGDWVLTFSDGGDDEHWRLYDNGVAEDWGYTQSRVQSRGTWQRTASGFTIHLRAMDVDNTSTTDLYWDGNVLRGTFTTHGNTLNVLARRSK